MLDGLIKLMSSNYIYPVNLGNPHEIEVQELSKILLEIIPSKSKIINLDLPQDDPTNRKPDIQLAKQILNWEPKTKLEVGLNNTIDFLKKDKILQLASNI